MQGVSRVESRMLRFYTPLKLLYSVNFHLTAKGKLRGFSLIELLVVLLIIGLGISMLNLNLGGSSALRLRSEAKIFAQNTALMAEEAVLSNQQWGVDIYRQHPDGNSSETANEVGIDEDQFGYRWLVRNDEGEWLTANDSIRENDFLFPVSLGLRLELENSEQEQDIEDKQKIPDPSTLSDTLLKNQMGVDPVIPELWLLSSGEMTAFSLVLFDKNNPEQKVHVEGDVLGRVTIITNEKEDDY